VDGKDVFVTTAYFTGRGEALKDALAVLQSPLEMATVGLVFVLLAVAVGRGAVTRRHLLSAAVLCTICGLLTYYAMGLWGYARREPTTDLSMELWLWSSWIVALCLAASGSKCISGRWARLTLGLVALGFAAFIVFGRPSPEYFTLQGDKRYAKEFYKTLAMPCVVGAVLVAGALWRPRSVEGVRGSFWRRCAICLAGWGLGVALTLAAIARVHAAGGEPYCVLREPFGKYAFLVFAVGYGLWAVVELITPEPRTARLPQWLSIGFLALAGLTFYEKNYLLVEREFVRAIVCLDADTGDVRWTTEGLVAPQPPTNKLNSPATPTPLVLGDRVVAWFGSAGAMCVDRSGKELWTNLELPYEGVHGVAASPMPAAGRIIISSGQPGAPYLAALDPETGQRVWTATLEPWGGKEGQHRTPTVVGDLILQWGWEREEGNDWLWALDAGTGALAWKHPVKTFREAVASLVVDGDRLILPCSRRITALSLKKLIAGEPPELWSTDMKRKGPYASTPVVVNGLLFAASNQGHVSCLDVKTGELLWTERLVGSRAKGVFAAAVAGQDSVLFCARSVQVVAVAAAREFRELASAFLDASIHASPALADGRLYIRTESHLWCIEE